MWVLDVDSSGGTLTLTYPPRQPNILLRVIAFRREVTVTVEYNQVIIVECGQPQHGPGEGYRHDDTRKPVRGSFHRHERRKSGYRGG